MAQDLILSQHDMVVRSACLVRFKIPFYSPQQSNNLAPDGRSIIVSMNISLLECTPKNQLTRYDVIPFRIGLWLCYSFRTYVAFSMFSMFSTIPPHALQLTIHDSLQFSVLSIAVNHGI
jgi:hypothetical protein